MTSKSCAPKGLELLGTTELTSRVTELLRREQLCLVEFLWHLAELDRRRTYLDLAYPSLFEYCTGALRLTKGAAFRRTTAARLLARFPVVHEYLTDGRLCLTTLVLLRDVLTVDGHLSVLERAAGKTEDEVKVLVAELQRPPEVKDSIRRLPPAAEATPSLFEASPPASDPSRAPALASTPAASAQPEGALASANTSPARPRIAPMSAARTSVQLTVSTEFMEELAQAKSALSHVVPDGNLEAVLRECMRRTVEACLKRRRGAEKARQTRATAAPHGRHEGCVSGAQVLAYAVRNAESRTVSFGPKPKPRSRYIPASVRRAVWERDGGCCSYVGANGRRCGSTYQVEFHHTDPFALGGEATVETIALRCRPHNVHHARQDFGEEHMARFGASRGAGCSGRRVDPSRVGGPAAPGARLGGEAPAPPGGRAGPPERNRED